MLPLLILLPDKNDKTALDYACENHVSKALNIMINLLSEIN